MNLSLILTAIREGVRLLRLYGEHVKAKIETDIFGPLTKEEVDQFLALRAKLVPEASNYSVSIVDLLKVLGLDSTLSARKELAAEFGWHGDTSNTENMNIWLHNRVLHQLAEREYGNLAGREYGNPP